jgi:hypothetical protein
MFLLLFINIYIIFLGTHATFLSNQFSFAPDKGIVVRSLRSHNNGGRWEAITAPPLDKSGFNYYLKTFIYYILYYNHYNYYMYFYFLYFVSNHYYYTRSELRRMPLRRMLLTTSRSPN